MHKTHMRFESPDGKGELISEAGDLVAFTKGHSFMIADSYRGF